MQSPHPTPVKQHRVSLLKRLPCDSKVWRPPQLQKNNELINCVQENRVCCIDVFVPPAFSKGGFIKENQSPLAGKEFSL